MGKALLTFLGLSFSLFCSAQLSVSAHPGTASGSGIANNPDIAAYCHVTNNSTFPINLLWSRSVVSKPAEWSSWACDMNNCYLPHVNACPESFPNILDPGQSFEFSYHVKPSGVDGNAEFKVYFYELTEQENMLDSVTFTFETTASAVDDVASAGLRIFPNPTTSYFQINNASNVASVSLYNMVGSKVREFDATSNTRFDVADLTEGVYLVRLLDAQGFVLKTVRLSKR